MYLQEPLKVLQGKGEKEMSLVPNNPPQTMVFTMHCRYSQELHTKSFIACLIIFSMKYNTHWLNVKTLHNR